MKHFILFAFLLSALTLAAQTTPTATLDLMADSPNTLTSGGTLTFTATASDYPSDTTALAWAVTVPAGWSYTTGTGEPNIAPSTGTTVLLEWAYFDVPASSAAFTFQVSYPGDVIVDSQVTAEVILRNSGTTAPTILPVDAVAFEPAPTLDNTINFPAIADQQGNSSPFDLAATSPSGETITYTVVSGPALISGNTVTLTGATGDVVIRADQGGDLYFLPANSVSQSFAVLQSGPIVYFGIDTQGNDFAVNIPEGQSTGTLFGSLDNGDFYILTFQVLIDRSVQAISFSIFNPFGGAAATDLARSPLRARVTAGSDAPRSAADLAFNFTGTVVNGKIVLQIPDLNLTLNGTVEPPTGPTAPLAGLYEANSLNSSSGTTTSIVGTTGKVYVLAITPNITTGGLGAIATDGTFSFSTDQNITIQGNVDAPSTTVSGTLILPNGDTDLFQGLALGTERTDRLINLSTRAYVDAATGGALVTGFVIDGPNPKHVLLRAIGPTLAEFGVTGALADPQVTIFDATGTIVAEVDDWGGTTDLVAAHSLVGAFPLPLDSTDASHLLTLQPGPYTMRVSNQSSAGIALAEIYDAAENPNSEYQRLVNISSRGQVIGADGVLVAGFIVTGNSPKRVLVRGVGPGLTAYGVTGVLTDPRIHLYNGDEQVVARNDNWATADPVFTGQRIAAATEIETTNAIVGAFSLDASSTDSAIVITLSPGAYTVHLDSATLGQTGNALIEIYEIPEVAP